MQIQQKSVFSLVLKSKNGTVVINPDSTVKESISLFSKKEDSTLKVTEDTSNLNILGAGEYEAKDLYIEGEKIKDEEIYLYTVNIDDINIGVIAHIQEPSKISGDFFDDIEVLLVGAGGGVNFDPQKAHEIIQRLSPGIAIVYGFKEQSTGKEQENLISVEEFKKLILANPVDKTLKLEKSDVEGTENTIIYYFT